MASAAPSRLTSPGFTLLEVLVALVILTLSLGAVMQLFSGGLRATTAAQDTAAAARLAQGRLAQLGQTLPLSPGTTQGTGVDQDGKALRWTQQINGLGRVQGLALYDIQVRVETAAGRQIDLRTKRLVRAP